jgi:hypothetical protein
MRKLYLFVAALIGLVAVSCQSDNSDDKASEKIVLQLTGLDGRVSTENAKVVGKKDVPAMPDGFYDDAVSAKSATVKAASTESDVASDIVLSLVGEVEPPVVDGVQVQATHVVVNGNYAYVSYNVRGEAYKGAVDLIDVSDPTLPQVAMEVTFPSMEISSLALKDDILYMVGARDVDAYDEVTSPAVLVKMQLDGDMLSEDISYQELEGTTGTDIAVGDNSYYSVSGTDGALASFAVSGGTPGTTVDAYDLRAVGIDGENLVTLSGTDGFKVYSLSTMAEKLAVDLSDDVEEAKRTIDFYDNNVLIARGFNGVGIYSLADGSAVNNLPMTTVDDTSIDANDLVCNAVTTSDDHIFMAEWAAGIVAYSLKGTDLAAPAEIGALGLDGSANYVANGDGYVFVADGTGGLKILKVVSSESDEDGTYPCSSYPAYNGGSWLNINSGSSQSYSSSNTLAGLNVNDQLIWCGDLAVQYGVNINSGGELDVDGTLTVGSRYDWFSINTVVVVTGDVTVYGSLNLNSNARLEIVGDNAKLTVTNGLYLNSGSQIVFDGTGAQIAVRGNIVNNGGTVTGNYTDVNGNIH